MAEIVIKFKDGGERVFANESRPGGSWTNSIRYEGEFAIVTDIWGNEFAYPARDIEHIQKAGQRGMF